MKFLGVFREEQTAQSDCMQPRVQNRITKYWGQRSYRIFTYLLFTRQLQALGFYKFFLKRGLGEALHMISMNLLSKDTKQLKLQLNSEFQISYLYKLTLGFQGITHVYQYEDFKMS